MLFSTAGGGVVLVVALGTAAAAGTAPVVGVAVAAGVPLLPGLPSAVAAPLLAALISAFTSALISASTRLVSSTQAFSGSSAAALTSLTVSFKSCSSSLNSV